MLDKFNFYDIYGYLLPGTLLLLLVWLPIGLVSNAWPAGDWSSAVIGVVLAYISGHMLQMFAGKVLPSSVEKGADKQDRFPSERLLDSDNGKMSFEAKTEIADLIKKKFTLDVAIGKKEDKPSKSKALDQVRRDAFYLARHSLILGKDAGYAEQFESMYALARGMAAAMGLAVAYYLGWAFRVMEVSWAGFAAVIAVTLGLLAAINASALLNMTSLSLPPEWTRRLELLCALGLLAASLGIGYGLGQRYQVTSRHAAALLLFAGGALLGSLRSYSTYRSFIETFSLTVWRDFLSDAKNEQAGTNSPGGKPQGK
ncbi:MAG: hypothetical protein LAO20_21310 [Acidobacteriia bacterium]|nr:hypothetical protein [Terriglobia bacterium]